MYKAFGELRSTPSALGTDYKFTGQREEASLGIYFFVARWFDPSLGRFTSPDSIVPTSTQGTQAWDRYAFVNNNPVRYNDPTGHMMTQGDGGCADRIYCESPAVSSVLTFLDSVLPSHVGIRVNLEISLSIPNTRFGVSIDIGVQSVYNRNDNEIDTSADVSVSPGAGVSSTPVGAAVTAGPVVGWNASDNETVMTGNAAATSASEAYPVAPAANLTVSTPLPLANDPVYGRPPITVYVGVGYGGSYAGASGGLSHVFYHQNTLDLPWYSVGVVQLLIEANR